MGNGQIVEGTGHPRIAIVKTLRDVVSLLPLGRRCNKAIFYKFQKGSFTELNPQKLLFGRLPLGASLHIFTPMLIWISRIDKTSRFQNFKASVKRLSNTQVSFANVFIVHQPACFSVERDSAGLHDVPIMSEIESKFRVLLDQDD